MTAADSASLVCVGPATLRALHESLERTLGDQAAPLLQEVGYASGPELYQAFKSWLGTRANVAEPAELDASFLSPMVSEFFEGIGWGTLTIEQLGDATFAIDTTHWIEVGDDTAAPVPSCDLTTGLLAAFFTELAGQIVAVMQVECLTCGDDRCRFLAGAPAALQRVFDAMTEGRHYTELLTA
jgi:predicted hydrocarbon binding protein